MMRRWRALHAVVAVTALAASLSLVALAPPASSQQAECPPPDPYSGGEPCPREITLSLSLQFGPAGVRIRIQAYGFVAGDIVTGTFDGEVVFRTVAQPGVGQETAAGLPTPLAAAGLNALRSFLGQADSTTGGIDEIITVPNKPPATYPVCVSGSGAQACADFRITATEVQGQTFTRGETVASGGTSSNGASGTRVLGRQFARTGLAIGFLPLLAVSLILVGRFLRVTGRRRRLRT